MLCRLVFCALLTLCSCGELAGSVYSSASQADSAASTTTSDGTEDGNNAGSGSGTLLQNANIAFQVALASSPNTCLQADNTNLLVDSNVVISPCTATSPQLWIFDTNKTRVRTLAGKCLTAVNLGLGVQDCNSQNSNQTVSKTRTSLKWNNLCLDTNQHNTSAGTANTMQSCNSNQTTQGWQFIAMLEPNRRVILEQSAQIYAASDANACPDLGDWDADAVAFEVETLRLINLQRAQGASCPDGGNTYGAQKPLIFDVRMMCVARAYAKYMYDNNFFAHTGVDGRTPFQRMTAAGVVWYGAAENLAKGQQTPAEAVSAWMSDAGHCNNLMSSNVITGIGYYKSYWVHDLATE